MSVSLYALYSLYVCEFVCPLHSLVKELKFSVVVFDTAPTGHTLRFLSMPNLFVKGLGKVSQIKSHLGGVFEQVSVSFLPG